jgi:hypothetical protein
MISNENLDDNLFDEDDEKLIENFDNYTEKVNNFTKAKLDYELEKVRYDTFLKKTFNKVLVKKNQWLKVLSNLKDQYKLSDVELKKVSNKIIGSNSSESKKIKKDKK